VAAAAVHLRSLRRAAGKLTLIVDGQEVTTRDVTLAPGGSVESFDVPRLAVGLHRVRAELAVTPDTYAENNVGEAAVRVLGRPLVLVLEGKDGEGQNVQNALQAAGMSVERRSAVSAPTDTTTLGRYDSTVVVNAAADVFPTAAMGAIAASVHDLGRGLVTVGGATSYGPGGWQGTPLEAALPVNMDIPKRKDKPKVAVVLVMESMEDPGADQVALGAAEAVIDKLSPTDMVAVTDGNQGFLVGMTPVRDKRAIDASLEAGELGDPPSYMPFFQLARDALQKTDAPIKHIVVLGDGDATEPQPQPVQSFLQDARAAGITTSSIGVDVHGQARFMSYMQDIARWGGGRFYQSNNPSQIPDLFLKESLTSLRPWFEREPFTPVIGSAGDLMRGVPTDAFPQLGGYVVTTPKPAAEQYLVSPKQDPVLAAWSFGLGRSVAWTSDSTGAWTADLLRSPVSAALFARMVAWTLPDSSGQRLEVTAEPNGDGLAVTVAGPAVAGGRPRLGVVRPDLRSSSVDLTAVAPGRWQGRIDQTMVGTYLLHAVVAGGGGPPVTGEAAVTVPYSAEYLELGRDDGLLLRLARDGGGVVLGRAAQAWAERPLPVPVGTDVFWVLLLLAALLWPLDVAARRISLRPGRVLANVVGYIRERRAADLEVVVPEELARLRSRLESLRRRPAGWGAADPGPPAREPGTATLGPLRAPPSPTSGPVPAEGGAGDLSARLLEARRRRRTLPPTGRR
jgi:uncharacterized membrane protein